MTQSEKIEMLKGTIEQLYAKEGRSKSYISRLLEVNRKILAYKINEWKFEQGNVLHLTPSNEKFLNRHKDFLIDGYSNGCTDVELAEKLGIMANRLRKMVWKHPEISAAREKYLSSIGEISARQKRERVAEIAIEDLPGETWKEILGYPGYYVSDMGRVKRYVKTYGCYRQILPFNNPRNGRPYIRLTNKKSFQVSRLVGFAFVDGHSDKRNTIDHIDGDVSNNRASNLQWVSQKENNHLSYDRKQRNIAVAHGKRGKFKEIVVDGAYHFKTIRAVAKFLGVSETQCTRYIDGECKSSHIFKFIY